ncbi:MAG: serine/threonine protein kinase, partial [Gammaproteobacteria bacterium]|nr:serine/threonine protein kinase [Gammaproteobacteria bacterium]
IGATAFGVGDSQVTPIGSIPPILTLAHTVSSILNEDFFVSPSWAFWAKWGAFILISIYLIALLPRLKAGMAAIFTIVLLLLLIGIEEGLLISQAMWLELILPASLLFFGHLLLTIKRFMVTEKGKEKSEAQSAESNRMLGLQFQGQNQLDMAFDAFRKVPLDDQVMDNLYNLALDFERKRQFNKAGSVYQYMSAYNDSFRDIKDRMSRTKAMEETVMLGGAGASTTAGTLIREGGGGMEKPLLGRHEVDKELGKGAMGVVYLGKDPKINRVVAIKTMALSQEFEADELEEVKSRFFREAETAGRLTHPHIVTIFDAG